MRLLVVAAMCLSVASAQTHAVEVRFRCGTAIVTGEPSEVTEFGLEYLRRLNPRIMATRSGREAVAAVCRCGASGRLNLVAEPKPWKDAIWSTAQRQLSTVAK